MLEPGAAVGVAVTAVVTVVVTALKLLTLGIEDEMVEEAIRGADCKDDIVDVCPVDVGVGLEEVSKAVVLVLSNVGVLLLLSTVIALAEHCPM